jgi:hypothetical protein
LLNSHFFFSYDRNSKKNMWIFNDLLFHNRHILLFS